MHEAERPAFHVAFGRPLASATELHANQLRKKTETLDISHLIGVAPIVVRS